MMPDAEAEALKEDSSAGVLAMTGGHGIPLATLVSAGLPEQLLLTLQQTTPSCEDEGINAMQQVTTVGLPQLATLGHHHLANVVNALTHQHPLAAQQTNQLSMPQLILAGGQLMQGIQGAQLLIPTSSGMATQHILTIPVNQMPTGQMVQMVASNGQLVTTSLGNPGMVTALGSGQILTTNAHGQLIAISPQVFSQPVVTSSAAMGPVAVYPQSVVSMSDKPQTVKYQGQDQAVGPMRSSSSTQAPVISVAPTVTSTSSTDDLPTNTSYPATSNATISQTDANTVDGINLEEIKEFAKAFKMRRLSLGLTQTQVGQALSVTEGPAYSQSAICRFEKLDITPKSAQKIKPVLERWMKEAEDRYRNGANNLTDFMGSEPSKKRKRRTSFTPQALELLNVHFERNTHPSGAEMTELAEKLNYDREVVRVWFCNKRQALKNTIKKLKSP